MAISNEAAVLEPEGFGVPRKQVSLWGMRPADAQDPLRGLRVLLLAVPRDVHARGHGGCVAR